MHNREPLPRDWQSHPSILLREPPPFSVFGPEDSAAFFVASGVAIIGQAPEAREGLYRNATVALNRAAFGWMESRRAGPTPQRRELLEHAQKLQRVCAELVALLGHSATIENYDPDIGHTDQVRAVMGLAAKEDYRRQLTEEWAPAREAELRWRKQVETVIRDREAEFGPEYFEKLKEDRRMTAAEEYASRMSSVPLPGDEYTGSLWGELRAGAQEARAVLTEPAGFVRTLHVMEAMAVAQLDRIAQCVDGGGPRTDFDRHWFVFAVCTVYFRCTGRRPAVSESRKTGLFIGPAPRFLAAVCACFSDRLHPVEIGSDSELRHVLQSAVTEGSAGAWISRARENLGGFWDFPAGEAYPP
jgi:hypothetical protein